MMSILNLFEEPVHITTLAAWHQAEWSHLNPDGTLEKRIEMMKRCLDDEFLPSTYIYKKDNVLVGSASIVKHDLHTRMDLSPWLASVFVAPEFRNQGFGSQLVTHVMQEAKEEVVTILYLFTPDREQFYSRLGWDTLKHEKYHGIDITVMTITFRS